MTNNRGTIQRRRDLFWLIVSGSSVHGHMALSLWACGEAEHYVREGVMEQSCYLERREREREKERDRQTDRQEGAKHSP
jgi:hypothetical protein